MSYKKIVLLTLIFFIAGSAVQAIIPECISKNYNNLYGALTKNGTRVAATIIGGEALFFGALALEAKYLYGKKLTSADLKALVKAAKENPKQYKALLATFALFAGFNGKVAFDGINYGIKKSEDRKVEAKKKLNQELEKKQRELQQLEIDKNAQIAAINQQLAIDQAANQAQIDEVRRGQEVENFANQQNNFAVSPEERLEHKRRHDAYLQGLENIVKNGLLSDEDRLAADRQRALNEDARIAEVLRKTPSAEELIIAEIQELEDTEDEIELKKDPENKAAINQADTLKLRRYIAIKVAALKDWKLLNYMLDVAKTPEQKDKALQNIVEFTKTTVRKENTEVIKIPGNNDPQIQDILEFKIRTVEAQLD